MSLSLPLLSVLTDDILARINEKLTHDSDRKTWRLVCKDFLRVESLTRTSIRVLRIEFLLSLLQRYTNIDSLDLSVCPRLDDGTVKLLLSSNSTEWVRRLKILNLSRSTGLKFVGFEMLVKSCVCLESVNVSYCCQFGDREAAALSCGEGLREVRMDKCLGVSDVGLAKIAVGCGGLERLSLKWCMEITDIGIELLCKKCSNLKFLDISYLKVTSESLCSIASLSKLEVLVMAGCPLIGDVGLQYLEKGCPSLQEINVSRCESVSSSGLISVIRGHHGLKRISAGYICSEISSSLLYCIKDLKNLKTISIEGARVSDAFFNTTSDTCKSLVEIGLRRCIGVTNMGIIQLVSGCIHLSIIDLTCCHPVTDAAISAIANSCWKLKCLKLEACNMLTEKSLEWLGSCCLFLEELDLTDCSGVTDRGLECLAKCSKLSCLKLGICMNISDKGLTFIASSCVELRELDLYRCSSIGDNSLAALSSGCKRLKILNVSYCNEITDRGMEFLGYLEELSDLEMRGLDKVTGVGFRALASRCRSLADLDIKHCAKVDDTGFWSLAQYSQNLRQINLSNCAISDMVLCILLGSLMRLQEAKLVHLTNVSVEGYELALRCCCMRIKKVKLDAALQFLLSTEILEILHARGCKIRWD